MMFKSNSQEYETVKLYLQSMPFEEQKIGETCWVDFVLRECWGIEDCNNPQLLTDLLGTFEEDSIIEGKFGKDRIVADLLKEYMKEIDDWHFSAWLENNSNGG